MSYTEEDAAQDAFYEEISQELYPEHKEQAVEEITGEHLRSFYIQHPDVMRPAVDALREGEMVEGATLLPTPVWHEGESQIHTKFHLDSSLFQEVAPQ